MAYTPSKRSYPSKLRPVEYPGHYTIRMVRTDGTFRWRDANVYCSRALIGEPLGLEEIADGRWLVCFGNVTLAVLDERRAVPHLLHVG